MSIAVSTETEQNEDMSITAGITAAKASLELAKLLSDRLSRPDIDVADVRAKAHEMLIHMVTLSASKALGINKDPKRRAYIRRL